MSFQFLIYSVEKSLDNEQIDKV